jgi:hypothetical protein
MHALAKLTVFPWLSLQEEYFCHPQPLLRRVFWEKQCRKVRRTFLITHIDDQIKDIEMGGACNTRKREAKCIYIFAEKDEE